MTAQGLQVIDHSVHVTHEWINELTGRLGYGSKRSALRLMRVTLHHIRDHLVVDEIAQLSAQLPLLIRGFFFEGWVPNRTLIKERSVEEFVGSITDKMAETEEFCGRDDIACVFDLLNARISEGEVEDIRGCLSGPVRELWPAP